MVGCNERAQRFIHFPPKLGIPNKRLVVDFDVWRDGDQLGARALQKTPAGVSGGWGEVRDQICKLGTWSSRAYDCNSGEELPQVNDRQTTYI